MQFPELPPDETNDAGEPAVDSISFHFEDVEPSLPADPPALEQWLRQAAEAEGRPLYELSYIFCSDEYLLGINVAYLQHDFYTDVITFPYTDGALHGDIFISTERVADNARTLGVSFGHELCRVMIHGLLHLAGFRDETDEQEAAMRARENFHLEKLPFQV